MATYQFKQVDVFTDKPFFGNPVAVVLEADGLETGEMQRIAAWTNLSETTFVCRPSKNGSSAAEADYRLRIFTPKGELPFAGHPTVGSAHAVLESGFRPRKPGALIQECGAGLLPLSIEGNGPERRIFVRAPRPQLTVASATQIELLSAALGAPVATGSSPAAINVGPTWLVAQIDGVERLNGLMPDMGRLAALSRDAGLTGVTVFSLDGRNGTAVQVRSFAPAEAVNEDPVCGSGNASVGAYLERCGLLSQTGANYVSGQGSVMGRDGHVVVRVSDDGCCVEIGGHAVTVVSGTITTS